MLEIRSDLSTGQERNRPALVMELFGDLADDDPGLRAYVEVVVNKIGKGTVGISLPPDQPEACQAEQVFEGPP